MATKHAKTLDTEMFAKLMAKVAKGEHALRDQVMVLLSYKAGLRAAEIAGLEWKDVCDAEGRVRNDFLFVPHNIAKYLKERSVPMHPHLYMALVALRIERPRDVGVIYGVGKGRVRMSPVAVRVWFHRLYEAANFEGCSSHSGRRTFITNLARQANNHGCSIKDVQSLAGHRRLDTTEVYIELSPHVSRLVQHI